MNNKLSALKLLQQNLQDLNEAKKWLAHSYEMCAKIGGKQTYATAEFDNFENLTSRFARVVDFIINKVLRSLFKVELEDVGSTIDVINKAHKKGLIDDAQTLKKIKMLRNEIAHEYTNRQLSMLFADILTYTPTVLDLAEKVMQYSDKYITK